MSSIFPRSSNGSGEQSDSRRARQGDERRSSPTDPYPREADHAWPAGQGVVTAPNIRYDPPTFRQHRERMRRSLLSSSRQRIPSGLPLELTGDLLWTGQGLGLEDKDIYFTLESSDVEQIELGVKSTKDKGVGFDSINTGNFVLQPARKHLYDQLRNRLHNGPGFFVLRGLNIPQWQHEDRLRAFLGVSKYIASEVGWQNPMGLKNLHVTNVKTEQERQPIYSDAAVPFHTDVICGVLAMYYINVAQAGGELLLASVWKVYNELAAKYPRMISLLASSDWPLQDAGENPSYHKRALLHPAAAAGKVVLSFSRRLLTGSSADPRPRNVPSLSEEQYDTLNELHYSALEHSVKLKLQPGDMVFINNFAVMHCRNEFKDGDRSKRHAIRLWLNDSRSDWNPIPRGLAVDWLPVFGRSNMKGTWRTKPPTTSKEMERDSTKCG